ncbi:MAG TPA: hypothetical protein VFZ69_05780 [Longimicrobiales bacterium]
MSDRIARAGAAALVIAASATSALAQTPAAGPAAHIDSLTRVYEMQVERLRVLDSIRQARLREVRTDTVLAGPFLVIDRDTVDMDRAAAALRRAWAAQATVVGKASGRVEGAIVTMTLPPSFTYGRDGARQYRFEPFVWGSADFERAARRVVASVLTDALPADVRVWLDGGGVQPAAALEWSYRELVTAHSHAARGCFAGAVDACMTALGLSHPGADWSGWYTPDELRVQVAQRGSESAPATACVRRRDDAACFEESRLSGGALPPLRGASRTALLAHVLELGGAGAYARLFDDARDVSARLAHAADRPIEDVVAGWRSSIDRARPSIYAGVLRGGLWTLVCLAALAVLATRSTRWRIG